MTRPAAPLVLTLPEPPSANRWWRHVGSRVVTSAEARQYKQDVMADLLQRGVRPIPAPTPVCINVTWYRGRKSGDLDKRLGVLLDALQGTAYDNDSQIVAINAERFDDPRNARCEVMVFPMRDFHPITRAGRAQEQTR